MWRVNREFLSEQIKQGKTFILSHNPFSATGFYQKEIDFLRNNGYKFIKDGNYWKAVK